MTKGRGLRKPSGVRAAWVAAEQGRHICACGCGEPVPLKPIHFNKGVPRYVHGHNTRVANPRPPAPQPPSLPCACGCGQLAGPGKRFISSHNLKGRPVSAETRAKIRAANLGKRRDKPPWNAKPTPAAEPCGCGCGQLATPGRRFLSGHNSRGQRTAAYRGWYEHLGYIYRDAPGHPYANSRGYLFEHRLVMEAHLRETQPDSPYLIRLGDQLYLRPEYIVHHRNDPKSDNRLENLQVLTNGEHVALHHAQRRQEGAS